MNDKRDPRGQGDQGEFSAMMWFGFRGDAVFMPIGHSRDFDFIAVHDHQLMRVQVKTSTCFRHNRWDVTVCTRGGNQSWNGLVKRLDPTSYDYLFVLVADGRRWLIPSSAVGGASGIYVGGPRYAAFEIDPDPIGLRPLQPPRTNTPLTAPNS
jgi:hypothetical protein